jgi:uncharacterized protein YegL
MNEKTKKIERIYNLIILDESGSMHGLEKMSVDGVNETIQTIKGAAQAHPEQEQMFSFVTFSGRGDRRPYRVHTLLSEISKVNEITMVDYHPMGNTPLWDTMGIALSALEREVDENAIALVTIITDGYENSSREYSGKQIQEIIKRLDSKGWVFTYIGANQDAMMEAGKLGIRNSLNFCADEEGTKRMWMKEKASRSAFYAEACKCDCITEDLQENYFQKGEFDDLN